MKLYRLTTTVNGFQHWDKKTYDGLEITWFIGSRPPEKEILWDFPDLIDNYENLGIDQRQFPESFLEEKFTEAEKETLFPWIIEYLESICEVVSTEIAVTDTPIPSDAIGVGTSFADDKPTWGIDNEEGYHFGGFCDIRKTEAELLEDLIGRTPSQEELQQLKGKLGGIKEHKCEDGETSKFAFVAGVNDSSCLWLYEENGKLLLGVGPYPI
jgi:hypothetical protein